MDKSTRYADFRAWAARERWVDQLKPLQYAAVMQAYKDGWRHGHSERSRVDQHVLGHVQPDADRVAKGAEGREAGGRVGVVGGIEEDEAAGVHTGGDASGAGVSGDAAAMPQGQPAAGGKEGRAGRGGREADRNDERVVKRKGFDDSGKDPCLICGQDGAAFAYDVQADQWYCSMECMMEGQNL